MDGRRAIAQRVGRQDGFGLVELLIAMTVMVVGIMAVFAAFSAGALSLQRAAKVATAGTVADKQMERYRAVPYTCAPQPCSSIALDGALIPGPAPYTTDAACGAAPSDCSAANQVTGATCDLSTRPEACPSRTVAGADGKRYRVDAYIKLSCAVPGDTPPSCGGSSRTVKLVTIIVRDSLTPSKTLFRESSTFDAALG
jgi:Tfp pilus assembly protein PilV